MPNITFNVETAAKPKLVVSHKRNGQSVNTVVGLSGDGPGKFKGSLPTPTGRVLLTWIFVGSPGTTYAITLSPASKVTLSRGSNPIKSRIATRETAGTGGVFVTVSA